MTLLVARRSQSVSLWENDSTSHLIPHLSKQFHYEIMVSVVCYKTCSTKHEVAAKVWPRLLNRILHRSTWSSKCGHFSLQKNKIATTNAKLKGLQTSGWRHDGLTLLFAHTLCSITLFKSTKQQTCDTFDLVCWPDHVGNSLVLLRAWLTLNWNVVTDI